MQALLMRLIGLILPSLEKYVFAKVSAFVGALLRKLSRHKEVDQKVDDLEKAGENPALSPEQKAKEIEDAFEKLSDSANRLP